MSSMINWLEKSGKSLDEKYEFIARSNRYLEQENRGLHKQIKNDQELYEKIIHEKTLYARDLEVKILKLEKKIRDYERLFTNSYAEGVNKMRYE